MYNADVSSVIQKSRPEPLAAPVVSISQVGHAVNLALSGQAQLAADYVLIAAGGGKLVEFSGDIIRRLNLEFIKARPLPAEAAVKETIKIQTRQRAYETLIELAVNLCGMERQRAGFSERDAGKVFKIILYTLEQWEALEKQENAKTTIAQAVVNKMLLDMGNVMRGAGMVAQMGEEIKKKLVDGDYAGSFVTAAKQVIQNNSYYRMISKNMCKFGNDYALGLRWLRRLGFVQVSTNPVLAAIAYNDCPELWDEFRLVAVQHKEWYGNPDKYGDEIAMQATMVALWPNLEIFRPIALLSNFHDGMVSYQLNPNVAASLEGSVEDALKIYASAADFLKLRDAYLTFGADGIDQVERPNMVFKVAAAYPAAVDVTAALTGMGIGTNNTVTYTVTQEVALILAAMQGLAEAMKRGIRPTQVYETNMGGRLESHLRDVEAEKLILQTLSVVKDKQALLGKLAEGLGAKAELDKQASLEEKAKAVCGFKYLKKLTNPAFIEAIASAESGNGEKVAARLTGLENDIGLAGTYVAQRVFWLFFSAENKPKWLSYLQKTYGVSRSEADEIIDNIDVLPASKRKPADTLLTLAEKNMTNTEFPNHQWAVAQAACQPEFDLSGCCNSIERKPEAAVLKRLLKLDDFRKAYELTPELIAAIKKAGVDGEFGGGGLKTEDWERFGSVVKTMNEFGAAYENFKKNAVDVVKKLSQNKS